VLLQELILAICLASATIATPQDAAKFFPRFRSVEENREKVASDVKRSPSKKVLVVATAYYRPLPNQTRYLCGSYEREIRMNGAGKETSSGERPERGTISADPRFLPRGTKISVPGYGPGIVQDTGGAIKGNRIDLFCGEGDSALDEAIKWGKRRIVVEVSKCPPRK